MRHNDEALMTMMIDIMDIHRDPEYIGNLNDWVSNDGIDAVFKKVIQMYALTLNQ